MSDKHGIFSSIKMLTSLKMKQNKDSSVVKLISGTVKALDTATESIDKFLKKGNIDVKEMASSGKKRAKASMESIKKMVGGFKSRDKGEDLINAPETGSESENALDSKLNESQSSGLEPPGDLKSLVTGLLSVRSKEDAKESISGLWGKLKDESKAGNLLKSLTSKDKVEEKAPPTKETLSAEERLKQVREEHKEKEAERKAEYDKGMETFSDIKTIKDKATETWSKIKDKREEDKESDKEERTNEKGQTRDETGKIQKGWWTKRKENRERRNEEIEKEKEASKGRLSNKNKKSPSWLSKIMKWGFGLFSGIQSIATFGIKKMGSLLWSAAKVSTRWLGKKILSGLGNVVTKLGALPIKIVKGLGNSLLKLGTTLTSTVSSLIPNSVKNLASKGKGLFKKGLGFVGKGKNLLKGKALGNALRGGKVLAKKLMPKVGTFLAKRALPGVLTVLSGPVGWVVGAGLLAWDAYQLYKYITRNKIPDTIPGKLTRARLLSYGISDANKSLYSKVFSIEETLGPSFIFNREDKTVTFKGIQQEQMDSIHEILGSEGDEEKTEIVKDWVENRVVKAYGAFLQALWSVDEKLKPGSITKLKHEQNIALLDSYKVPSGVFDVLAIPNFDSPRTEVVRDDFDSVITNIRNELNSGQSKSKDPVEKTKVSQTAEFRKKHRREIQKRIARTKLGQSTGSSALDKQREQMQRRFSNPNSLGKTSRVISSDDGEIEPKESSSVSKPSGSTAPGNLKEATGKVIPGDSSFTGIKLNTTEESINNLEPEVHNLFTGMAKEYNQLTGKDIQVNRAWSSTEKQAELHRKNPRKAAAPGRSLHEYGLAIDINTVNTKELDKLGLLRKYGFTAGVGGETWHLEPIGVSLDPDSAKHDLGIRSSLLEIGPGRGGYGYGLERNSPMGRRNYDLQKSIASAKSDPISTGSTFKSKVVSSGVDDELLAAYSDNSSPATDTKVGPYKDDYKYDKGTNLSSPSKKSYDSSEEIKPSTNTPFKLGLSNATQDHIASPMQPKTVKESKVESIPSAPVIDLNGVESILSNQLKSIGQMVDLLTSIDGKLDPSLFAGNTNEVNNQTASQVPSTSRKIPKSAVSLSRRELESF